MNTTQTDFATLRYAARLVICRGLDGRNFAAAVDSTPEAFARDDSGSSDAVREAAVYIRWRMPEARPAEVARHLVWRANRMEAIPRGG